MATTRSRKIKVPGRAKKQAVTRKVRRNETDFAGGRSDVIGFTADLNGLTGLESVKKNVYGLFATDVGGYHHRVVEGNILGGKNIRVIEPVYAYKDLLRVYQASTILRQCVDSYVTNIESYGIELEYIGPEGQAESRAATNEKARITRLINTLPSDGRTLQQHREDSRVDKEVLGARCFEVIRDAVGRVVGFDHLPTVSIRMTTRDPEETLTSVVDPETGAWKEVRRRFRRFVQLKDNGEKVFFKELGDPRRIDPTTGDVNNSLSIEAEATEVYYEGLYSPGTPCGVPRWAGVIPSLLGGREAEMVNLNFFRDNAIPALAVLVSGGALTEESFDKIESYITGVRGAASMNRIVVMEAVSDGAEAAAVDGSLPAPKVDIKPMLSERQHEGLFEGYITETERKARSSFRLPPIYIGSASEYNRASAFASVLTADQQIFIPERFQWDAMFERVVLSTHNIKYWRVRSAGAGLQDPAEVARIVNSLGREGALTPNICIKLANRYLDTDIQTITDDWGNVPFGITMQHIKDGRIIAGLDEFEEALNENLPEDEDDDLNLADANVPLAKTLRKLLNGVVDSMQEKLDAAVQSIATEDEYQ